MVIAWSPYADGNLQFFGNVQSVELDGECTGRDCQTEEGVTPPPQTTTPAPGGTSKLLVKHICAIFGVQEKFSLF